MGNSNQFEFIDLWHSLSLKMVLPLELKSFSATKCFELWSGNEMEEYMTRMQMDLGVLKVIVA